MSRQPGFHVCCENSFSGKSGRCSAWGGQYHWGVLGLEQFSSGFVGKAWKEEVCVFWGCLWSCSLRGSLGCACRCWLWYDQRRSLRDLGLRLQQQHRQPVREHADQARYCLGAWGGRERGRGEREQPQTTESSTKTSQKEPKSTLLSPGQQEPVKAPKQRRL